jgi:CBS domain-containing protein
MDVVDVMTRDVLTVSPASSIREAARMMIDGGFSGVPVVEIGKVVGVLSEADYLAKDGNQSWISRVLFGEEDSPLAEVEKVKDLMSAHPVTIRDSATVQEAARVMIRKGVKRLPVLDSKEHLVGIVTRADLIRSYVRPDDAIESEVKQMTAVLPTPMCDVNIKVVDGVVILSGDVETSAEARALVRIVKGIEGVASVKNELDWEIVTEMGDNPYSGYPLEGAEV